jgi:hypothetical protein
MHREGTLTWLGPHISAHLLKRGGMFELGEASLRMVTKPEILQVVGRGLGPGFEMRVHGRKAYFVRK